MAEDVKIILQSRYDWIEEAVQQCVRGELSFDDLCGKVAARGFRTTSLYEMVRAAEEQQ